MTQNDILTLARAGFTAQQISALAQMQPFQKMQTVQQMQPVQQMQTVQQMQPVQQPVQQMQPVQPMGDPFTQQLAQLTQAIQANGILSAQQPKLETADDVLASIINPPKIEKK